ncbi:ABC transporter substrate-binding protein [Abyssisolibacter fermentans]|uniref:ABC transporter substrate-binding protein n=1 Tax=Abyssisolibacter fermentans TaxID=1766203 RepID=UPI0008328DB9|nr:ABC transporter substrate-binding protein [Abyssisolibacter fermentans]
MKKIIVVLLTVLMVVSLFSGCTPKESEVVKLAIAAPLTGDFAEYGTGFKNAVELMVEQWNSKGGVLDKKVEVVVYDDKNNGEEAATIAEKIIGDSDIAGVVGHFASGVCMAASPTYQEAGIVEISPSASHPDYSSEGDYIFRNNTVINVEAKEAIEIAVKALNAKNIGILSVKTDWGTATAGIVKEIANDYEGVKVVEHQEIIDGTVDFSPVVTAFNEAKPDVVIVVGMYNVLAPFATQYKAVNPEINFVGFSNAYSQELINLGKEYVEGVYLPAIFFHGSENENIKNFVEAYEAKYGSAPSSLTAQAYDSAGIILSAIENTSSIDRSAIKDELYKISYPGVTGQTTFNEKGDAQKTFAWLKVENGAFVEVSK